MEFLSQFDWEYPVRLKQHRYLSRIRKKKGRNVTWKKTEVENITGYSAYLRKLSGGFGEYLPLEI